MAYVLAEVPVTGQVFSSSGNPLAYSVIADSTGQNWVIADENGYFNYNFHTPINQRTSLKVSRYGYQTGTFWISDNSFHIIELLPQPIEYEPVVVTVKERGFSGHITNIYQHNINNDDPHNIFQQIPGISIRSYGGKAGGIFLSSNGSPIVNTKVILNDIDLTNAQFGSTDISLIPEPLIDQISVVNTPGVFYGSGAGDGILKISNWQNNSSISATYGSYGYKSINSNYFNNWKKFSINLLTGYLTEDGDFKYLVDKNQFTRENNDFERKYIAINSTIKISDTSNIYALFIESHQNRGTAGSIAWPSLLARRDDKLQLGSLSYNHLNKGGYSNVQLSIRNSVEDFDDPNPFWPISSKHTVLGNSLKIHHKQEVRNNIVASILLEGNHEIINSTDVSHHERLTKSIATEITIPLWQNFKIFPAYRVNKVENSALHPTKSVRLTYFGMKKIELEYGIGTSYRNPTFNDLYWIPGGNPDLKPEISWNQSLKFKKYLNNNYNSSIYLNIYENYTDDQIQWAPIDDTLLIWQPQNIARSHKMHLTLGNQIKVRKSALKIAWHISYQKTQDLDLKKPLLYAPDIIGFFSLNYTVHAFSIRLQAHYTGKRLSEYGYDDDIYLLGYWNTSATIQYQIELFNNLLSFNLNASNLFDKQIMSMNDYPEPGRIVMLSLKYSFSND